MKLNKKLITGIGGVVLLLILVVLIGVASAERKMAEKHAVEVKLAEENAPRPVRCEKVKAEPLSRGHSYPGVVKASEETALSFRVGGPLTEVNVVLGEPVKKGDLLLQIDPRDFEDRIQSLEAQLAGAAARLANARQDYRRVTQLFEENVVAQADYDRAESANDSAEAAVKNIEAQLQIARHALEDTSLRAPYDGTVTAQRVENHEMISPGAVVLQYHAIDKIEIVVNIPENEMGGIPLNRTDSYVEVSFPALRSQTFSARLKEWSTLADPLTRTYAVTFELNVPEGVVILPGMTANVAFSKPEEQALVLTVPVSALVAGPDGGSSVWVYDEEQETAALRSVQVGVLSGDRRVVIAEGIAEGEHVVVSGSRLIHENQALKTASVH
ncbi:efflux RND transporter periplasmic adaptor subunit [Pontiella agarivorans]|uniref:Efflux RND transporter periplasmic adaptor subunit n=1 Tax=Pontiella agarivorans TaxID=3038953 RepID=A0ABU5MX79_9BACT|nr:efflux RND transporter periplasmic adaptor subunit [Pontiella agarivorans]MDZ8118804.1 efflux RND transporter periplasmic adaptor subunit [Pontiella agarivorans]